MRVQVVLIGSSTRPWWGHADVHGGVACCRDGRLVGVPASAAHHSSSSSAGRTERWSGRQVRPATFAPKSKRVAAPGHNLLVTPSSPCPALPLPIDCQLPARNNAVVAWPIVLLGVPRACPEQRTGAVGRRNERVRRTGTARRVHAPVPRGHKNARGAHGGSGDPTGHCGEGWHGTAPRRHGTASFTNVASARPIRQPCGGGKLPAARPGPRVHAPRECGLPAGARRGRGRGERRGSELRASRRMVPARLAAAVAGCGRGDGAPGPGWLPLAGISTAVSPGRSAHGDVRKGPSKASHSGHAAPGVHRDDSNARCRNAAPGSVPSFFFF